MGQVRTRDFSHPADKDLLVREGGPIEIEIADVIAHSSSSVRFVWSMSAAGSMKELDMMLASPSVVEAVSIAVTNLAKHYRVKHFSMGRDAIAFSAPYRCSARCGSTQRHGARSESMSYFAQQPRTQSLRSTTRKQQQPLVAEDDDDNMHSEGRLQNVKNPWSQSIISPRAYARAYRNAVSTSSTPRPEVPDFQPCERTARRPALCPSNCKAAETTPSRCVSIRDAKSIGCPRDANGNTIDGCAQCCYAHAKW